LNKLFFAALGLIICLIVTGCNVPSGTTTGTTSAVTTGSATTTSNTPTRTTGTTTAITTIDVSPTTVTGSVTATTVTTTTISTSVIPTTPTTTTTLPVNLPPEVIYDFSNGNPTPAPGRTTPFTIEISGLTATFDSSDKFSSFSIQNQATTFYKLSEITGNYLVDNSAYPNALIIKLNNPLRSMSFAFATLDYHGVGEADIPTSIKITAYGDSGMTQPIGMVDTKGVFITDATFPQGKLIFESAGNQSFWAVKIELIPQTKGTTYFLVDDITVKPALP
jgi:hypothetical protein